MHRGAYECCGVMEVPDLVQEQLEGAIAYMIEDAGVLLSRG